jgi:hypothetical protein
MNNSSVSIYNNECLNDEIINLSYYTQNTNILKPIEHINNVIDINVKKDSYNYLKIKFNNSSSYFIKLTE